MGRNTQEKQRAREMAITGLAKLLKTLNDKCFILIKK